MMQSLPTLHRMSSGTLSSLLLSKAATVAVIDVRDADHAGGHIRSSIHVPSSTLDYRLPELVRTLRGNEKVVFHCALSQQRGPGAARRYLGERERMGKVGVKVEKKIAEEGMGEGQREREGVVVGVEEGEDGEGKEDNGEEEGEQEVYVLDGGFVKWQERYGKDERLTEDYAADIWNDYEG